MNSRPILRVVKGGRSNGLQIGSVLLMCQDAEVGPPSSSVAVMEEDTWQVLSADPEFRIVDEHPIRIMTGLIDQKPLAIGDIVIQDRLHWKAVIYDFDQDPVCRREWVETAIVKLLEKIGEEKPHEITMPLLGSNYSCLSWRDSLEIVVHNLRTRPPGFLQSIWLVIPEDKIADVKKYLFEGQV